jgi:hypothetical protein
MKAALSLLLSFGLIACSTVPSFKPSRPVQETSTLSESLLVCREYQITGKDPSRRVSSLVPWIDCLDDTFERYPNARRDKGLMQLYYALQSRYASAPTPASPVIDAADMNFAVSSSLKAIASRSTDSYQWEESQAIGRELPRYWHYLSAQGQVAALPPGRSPASEQPLPPRPLPLTREQRDYCKRYIECRRLKTTEEELEAYKRHLDDATAADTTNADERARRERITARLDSVKNQAGAEQKSLETELARLQTSSSWFQNGYCLN